MKRMGLEKIHQTVDILEKRGGVLPKVDRTRGFLTADLSFIAYFNVPTGKRTVYLTLSFYRSRSSRQNFQGSQGRNSSFPAHFAVPVLLKKTAPGDLLLAAISIGSAPGFDNNLGPPPIFNDWDMALNRISDDESDAWTIHAQADDPAIITSGPFRPSAIIASRFVKENEVTYTPVSIKSGTFGGQLTMPTGVWLWEIPKAKQPVEARTGYGYVDGGDTLTIGEGLHGFVLAMFTFGLPTGVSNYPDIFGVSATSDHRDAANVPLGTISASSSRPGHPASAAVTKDVTVNWETGTHDGVDEWWQQTWASPVDVGIVKLQGILFHPFEGSHDNPASRLDLSDGATYDIPALGAVVDGYTIDLGGTHTITSLRITFTEHSPEPGFPGFTLINLYNIIGGVDDPQRLNDTEISNNPYAVGAQGWGYGNSPPWVYIAQSLPKGGRDNTASPISIHIESPDGNNHYPMARAAVTIPNLFARLPVIPWPQNQVWVASGELSGIKEVIGAGDLTMATTDLYASGVRVYIDGLDISQYIFNASSGIVDDTHNRFEDIDLSIWVKSPGDHSITVRCDEGDLDLDARFEVK